MSLKGVHVIVVPDDNAHAINIPPSILTALTQTSIIMSNDSLRMYVRHSKWEAMKESYLLTNDVADVVEETTGTFKG